MFVEQLHQMFYYSPVFFPNTSLYDIGYDDLNSFFDFNINKTNIYLQEITKCKI